MLTYAYAYMNTYIHTHIYIDCAGAGVLAVGLPPSKQPGANSHALEP
jgi:hypothetical protein